MRILLTGGLGFIGSHCAVALSNLEDCQNTVIILDNLSNSKIEVLNNIKRLSAHPENIHLCIGDVTNLHNLRIVFNEYPDIDAVIHFASLKAVGESIEKPLMYYKQNINGLISLLEVMSEYKCKKLIFSSSATVYGCYNPSPLFETSMVGAYITNPYGQTKYFQEQILMDYAKVNPEMSITILRYFNPVGAHPSGLIGENPTGVPNNLFPYLLRVASGQYECLNIFGDDYDTVDGTCIRDLIHVVDLAEGHVAALVGPKLLPDDDTDIKPANDDEYDRCDAYDTSEGIDLKGIDLKSVERQTVGSLNIKVYNLGSGRGTTVLQLVEAFEKVNGLKLPVKMCPRRPGDIKTVFADVSKVWRELGWKTRYTIEDICRDGYNFVLREP